MKNKSLSQYKDQYLGPIGTPERDSFEIELKKEIESYNDSTTAFEKEHYGGTISDIINELNEHLFKIDENSIDTFSYSTNGTYDIIKYNEFILWSYDEDEREFDEITSSYEPLLPFIKRQFNKKIKELKKFKFKNI